MCGIFGCISDEAATKVLDGLRMLEYRGYDSAGLAAIFPAHEGPIKTERTTGYVTDLVSKANGRFKGATISIGHTRWATHGGVTDTNAHPHSSNDGTITIVHNGIIENAHILLERVGKLGYDIQSETDSEVIVHLLDHELKSQPDGTSPLEAFKTVIGMLEGSWSIAVIMTGLDAILVARNGSPLIVGRDHDSIFVSSDVQPFYGCCTEVAYMNDGDVLCITTNGIQSAEETMDPIFEPLEGVYERADPGIHGHMMLKEIFDQPSSLSNALSGRIPADGLSAALGGIALEPDQIRNLDRINIIACGSAFYASKIGAHILRMYSDVPVEAYRASEFQASELCSKNTLTIGVSQSGETKDTLDALQEAKIHGSHISSFCNVIGSTMSRLTGNGAYLYAGPEYAVASTKAFTNMVAVFFLLALTISDLKTQEKREMISELRRIPNLVSKQLIEDDGSISKAVEMLAESNIAIFIARGVSAPLAEEGALKMMEVAYLPCLSYPGGELKHGPIALIEEGTPIIAIVPSDSNASLMASSIRECKTRGAKIIMISDIDGPINDLADVLIPTQRTHPDLSTIINAVPLQLLAFHLGLRLGRNVDRPRNLAKSVTVV